MANGYAGKILKVDLTTKNIEEIPTSQYEEWGGGHGMGSAVFWDLCEDPSIDGTDPRNVVTIMGNPLSGTLAPGAAARTEVQGIGLQQYPRGWFTRSNFGGRFAGQLKYAGWDGIAVLGKSETPVWINIVNGEVTLEDATTLWELETDAAQKSIWEKVIGSQDDWTALGGSRDGGRTTQRPAVLTCGPNAEKYGPVAALIHDAGKGAGQGGFGGVFASKNLKAISVLGTGGVEVADPNALMETRLWIHDYSFAGHHDDPSPVAKIGVWTMSALTGFEPRGVLAHLNKRPAGCQSCVRCCNTRQENGIGNESICFDIALYSQAAPKYAGAKTTDVTGMAADLIQKRGLNVLEIMIGIRWTLALYKKGILGPGKAIDSNLPWEQYGSFDFIDQYTRNIVENTDIGADLAKGCWRAAQAWGRFEEDLASADLPLMVWGTPLHYDARTELEWGYGSLMGERDINEHDFNMPAFFVPFYYTMYGMEVPYSAERVAEIISKKTTGDPRAVDYSDENMYSETMARTVAWHRHYTRYYKQSLGFCDWLWADFINAYQEDWEGMTGEGEPRLFNAVTGKSQSFEEGLEVGRRIWNLDRAIWVLQGRHRDMEHYHEYNYRLTQTEASGGMPLLYIVPVFEDGEWQYKNVSGRKLTREGVDEWKTNFYKVEGWDVATGWPTRSTLEELGLGKVADRLEAAKKLGAAS